MTTTSHAGLLLIGADAPYGAEIAARLTAAGHRVLPLDAQGLTDWLSRSDPADTVDALVVNVPVARSGLRFDDVDDAAFTLALQTHLVDGVLMTQAALPRMRAGARIVFVGARGHLGAWGGVHLMAASAGLAAMTRSMALELAEDGIRVNLVAAGFVDDRGDTPALRAAVAHAVEFLCAPALGISGETLLVDGNAALRMSESRRMDPPAPPPTPVPGLTGHIPP